MDEIDPGEWMIDARKDRFGKKMSVLSNCQRYRDINADDIHLEGAQIKSFFPFGIAIDCLHIQECFKAALMMNF